MSVQRRSGWQRCHLGAPGQRYLNIGRARWKARNLTNRTVVYLTNDPDDYDWWDENVGEDPGAIYGFGGSDFITGDAGDDYIDGGTENDDLWGGKIAPVGEFIHQWWGNDYLVGNWGNDY